MGAAGAAGGVADQFRLVRVGYWVELGDDLHQDRCGVVGDATVRGWLCLSLCGVGRGCGGHGLCAFPRVVACLTG